MSTGEGAHQHNTLIMGSLCEKNKSECVSVDMFIHVYLYVHASIYVSGCIFMCIYMCIYMSIYLYMHLYVYVYLDVHLYAYLHLSILYIGFKCVETDRASFRAK